MWLEVQPSEHGLGLTPTGRREFSCDALQPWQNAALRAVTFAFGPQQVQLGAGRAAPRYLADVVRTVLRGSAADTSWSVHRPHFRVESTEEGTRLMVRGDVRYELADGRRVMQEREFLFSMPAQVQPHFCRRTLTMRQGGELLCKQDAPRIVLSEATMRPNTSVLLDENTHTRRDMRWGSLRSSSTVYFHFVRRPFADLLLVAVPFVKQDKPQGWIPLRTMLLLLGGEPTPAFVLSAAAPSERAALAPFVHRVVDVPARDRGDDRLHRASEGGDCVLLPTAEMGQSEAGVLRGYLQGLLKIRNATTKNCDKGNSIKAITALQCNINYNPK